LFYPLTILPQSQNMRKRSPPPPPLRGYSTVFEILDRGSETKQVIEILKTLKQLLVHNKKDTLKQAF
jgi:hypothetical protein